MSYDFKKIENKWQKRWEEKKVFSAKENPKKKKFYCLDMFPYPSGTGLHMGHAFVFTLGDIFARFKRMQGFNVLYPIGYDALGLPAENAAIKVGIHPEEYTKKSIANFMKQQKAMGWSYDWSRMINTSTQEYYKWDQWLFLQMMKKGLAYRKKAPVNFCKKCDTVLANEQVVNGKCWRHDDTEVEIKNLEQWFFKTTNYAGELLKCLDNLDWPERAKTMQRNWIGKSEGAEILFEIEGKKYPIFTTRPDTLFGVTFLVVSAQHSELANFVKQKQKKDVENFLKKIKSTKREEVEKLDKEGVFSGSFAIHPLTKEKIPVWIGNFVLAEYGSGIVMAVPAHDQRDLEFAKKYKLPIKQVIRKEKAPVRSYLMGASKIKDSDLINLEIKIIEKTKDGDFKIEIPKTRLKDYEKLITEKMDDGFWNEYLGEEIVFIFKFNSGKIKRLILNDDTEEEVDKLAHDFMKESKWNKSCVWKWLAENSFYTDLIVHTDFGILVNSDEFNGLFSEEAKEHIVKALEAKKFGRKVTQYKLRDWLVSRQRYWGTPIPIVYCDKCGIVPVPEKDLPVKLPNNVKFGKGNPLATNEKWINVKCPRCGKFGRRETDTMDTFVNSSWYYLRYADPRNDKKIFETKKANYWAPVDMYIGGPEHITAHLIYARFYTKFLADLGLIKFREPALRYFTQGLVRGSDGEKMSKSKGNVVEPLETINKFGADSLRLYLVSNSSSDRDFDWSEKEIQNSFNFTSKVCDYFANFKAGKSDARVDNKLNRTIKEVASYAEDFAHNLAVIKIRNLFSYFYDKEIDKKTAESFLKMLHIYCPFVTEEIWENLGNKEFISIAEWPKCDEKKINEKFEKEEKAVEQLVGDINNILKIIKEKQKSAKKIFIYSLPNEKEMFSENLDFISKKLNLNVKIFAVNDKNKYDPEKKSSKAKPGKPAIYVE